MVLIGLHRLNLENILQNRNIMKMIALPPEAKYFFFFFDTCKLKVNCKHILSLISMLFSENIVFSVFLFQINIWGSIYKYFSLQLKSQRLKKKTKQKEMYKTPFSQKSCIILLLETLGYTKHLHLVSCFIYRYRTATFHPRLVVYFKSRRCTKQK